ncbi:MAG: Gfo/Idh/MocA family oxidoreductase [Planctomycetes bacterium]|nr:Gfo/Idh/MocA family oxidoreductase [Planctomycetota bacterium]
MASHSDVSRRTFVKGAAALAAFGVPAANVLGANDTLRVGCIGTGGRCRHLMKALIGIPNVRIAAVCDIYDGNLEAGRQLAAPKAFVTRKYKELLDRRDIDAVLIASPDHWHVPMTIDAVSAGKDVYVEKPLTHDLAEGKAILDAQAKHNRVVQVGTQQRSMPHIRKAYDLVRAGRLGTISKVHLTWNRNSDRVRKAAPTATFPKQVDWKAFVGNAPEQPLDEYRFRNWRWFWDFGGGLFTDLMVHWIDVAHWFLDLDHPLKAVSVGQHTVSEGVWQTPDTVQTLLVYPRQVQAHFEGTFSNAYGAAHIVFMGTDASLYIDRGRYEVHLERGRGKYEELVLGTGPRGRDFYDKPDGERLHLEDWIEAIRAGKQPCTPVKAGVSAASAAHLANQALRGSGVALWKA